MFATKARIAPPLDTIPTPNLTFYRITIDGPHDKTKRISELNRLSENLNECMKLNNNGDIYRTLFVKVLQCIDLWIP